MLFYLFPPVAVIYPLVLITLTKQLVSMVQSEDFIWELKGFSGVHLGEGQAMIRCLKNNYDARNIFQSTSHLADN